MSLHSIIMESSSGFALPVRKVVQYHEPRLQAPVEVYKKLDSWPCSGLASLLTQLIIEALKWKAETLAAAQVVSVSEFRPGNTLFHLLHGPDNTAPLCGWHQEGRFFALGIARGLAYLHSLQVWQLPAGLGLP